MLRANDQQVFLIDEDEVVRDSLKVLLESHGISVRDFRNAADFMARENPAWGGCLVLGCNRLIVEGLDLVATLRRRGIDLPVVFMVGSGDSLTRAAAMASGAFAYLERPIEETELIRAIRSALARWNGKPVAETQGPEKPDVMLSARP